MSEGGEQKPKTLIIYKTHTISYDHLSEGEVIIADCMFLVYD
jgi:hypothetical protein